MKQLIVLLMFVSIQVQAKTYQLLETKLYSGEVVKKTLTSNGVSVKFLVPSFEAESDNSYGIIKDDFQSLSFKGLENTKEVSKAALPYYSFIVKGIPSDFKVTLDKGKAFTVKGLKPAPAKELPCRCAKDKDLNPNIDILKYEEGRGLYKIEYLGDFKGVQLSKVTLSPSKYKNGLFEVYPEIEFSIRSNSQKNIVFNIDALPRDKKSEKNYLIVSASHLIKATNELADYKRTQGYKVKVVDLKTIGKTSAKLKTFFHEEYKRNGYHFALLVGHEDSMPTEYVETSSDAQTPSDLKYFTMGGSDDLIPDVYYGRIVANTAADVKNQLMKIKEYDQRSYSDASGTNHFVGIASDEGSDPTDVEYMEGFAKEFVDVFKTKTSFFFQEASNSNSRNINKALNTGASWLSYIGHGSGTSWSSVNRGDYNTSHIKELSPSVVKPVIIDVACQNGRFTYDGRLGERFMNETKNGSAIGAVAYYGGSVDISWHPPAVMARGINQAIASEGVKGLGESLLKGQLYLLANYDDRAAAEENLVWYHLFGDPSMNIRF
ncbi:MAG: hypothetical protein ACJAT2_001730 [Bacteriovoracaceae bacterium]|jgi:hypothetical protein